MEILESFNKHFQSCINIKGNNQMQENESDTTHQLVYYYVPYNLRSKLDHSLLAGLPRDFLIPPNNPGNLQKLIVKLCHEMEDKNNQFFDCLPVKLCITEQNMRATFIAIAGEIMEDGINWGRIVSLFTFTGVVSCHFMKQKKPQLVVDVAKLLTDYINENLMLWINANGGWDGLSQKMSTKSNLWRNALVIGGLWATTYFLTSRH